MYECNLCNKVFFYKAKLEQHQNRKTRCIAIPPENQCEYCHKVLSSQYNLELHKETCKLKDDPVRILEMKLNLPIQILPNKCRYCENVFARSDGANIHMQTCSEKQLYIESLNQLLEDEEELKLSLSNNTLTFLQEVNIVQSVNNYCYKGNIYVLRLRECINSNQNIYKVGRTNKGYTNNGTLIRFKQYPKGSELLFSCSVDNTLDAERGIIDKLRNTCKSRLDYGNEYFEGNLEEILLIVTQHLFSNYA